MTAANNTLFLRLTGPMQSWGTSSRHQLRRTDAYPSKSGVLGLLLSAMGVRREESADALVPLTALRMGVRVDRAGTLEWDYHTAGAGIGIRSADGKIKRTASTGEYETLVSRRQYLFDASFLVALLGAPETISACVRALDEPTWPVFLGRKCCVPTEPVFGGVASHVTLADALSSIPCLRINAKDRSTTRTLETFIEHPADSPPPGDGSLVYDVPRVFGFHSYGPRWIVSDWITVRVEAPTFYPTGVPRRRRIDYNSPQWKAARLSRLSLDYHLCAFCKSPAAEVHHVDYTNVGHETDADLRSLCKTCHDACTSLEYGHDMQTRRVDPSDPAQRPAILRQIDRLMRERRVGRRREILEAVRSADVSFFDDVLDSSTLEER